MKRPLLFLLALLSSAVTITPVVAAEPATHIVRTADLDLNSATGQRRLERRLSLAIAEVCGIASDADLAGQNEVRRCRVETRQRVARDRDQRIAASPQDAIRVAAR